MPDANAITLPKDQYAHPGTPTEWWWHIGTLTSGDRVFGFEIALNGASGGSPAVKFTQVMLTDVSNQTHYQATSGGLYTADWASADPAGPFYAVVNGGTSAGAMTAFQTNPLNMFVQASFTASFQDSGQPVEIVFQLQFDQQGPPLLVWGSGEQRGNYYYSLTNLRASGRIFIGGEEFPVTGTTWMDHEWGVFPQGTTWVLQDMQFPNGMSIMNYVSGQQPQLDQRMESTATVLGLDGVSREMKGYATPVGDTWKDRWGNEYFLSWHVELPDLKGDFTVTSLVPGQAFEETVRVYEGVARYKGTLDGVEVSGPAWNEQKLYPDAV